MKTLKQFLTENRHISFYTTAGKGYELNRKLKAGEPLTQEESVHKTGLESFIKANPLQHDVILYRGQEGPPESVIRSPGFMSFSEDYGVAEPYARNHQNHEHKEDAHMLRIQAKKGQLISNIDNLSMYQGEGEHLAHPNTKIVITSHEYDPVEKMHIHNGHIETE